MKDTEGRNKKELFDIDAHLDFIMTFDTNIPYNTELKYSQFEVRPKCLVDNKCWWNECALNV